MQLGSTLPALVAGLLLAAACERPAPPAPTAVPTQPQTGGTLVVAVPDDLVGVNPLLIGSESFNQDVARTLFLQLFEEQPDYADHPPTFAPRLAESWEWSDDRSVLELELRRDVVWSDGAPLTAADVIWTFERQIDPEIAWPYAENKESITAMEAVGEHRLRVRFTGPAPTRLAELNLGPILPRHRWAELPPAEWQARGDWFQERLVVSGPFALERWEPGREIVLVRNQRFYRDGLPRLDRVVFRVVPERTNRLNQLLSGDVHLTPDVEPDAAARITADPDLRLDSAWSRQYTFVAWNLRRSSFADPRTRRALTHAIDRQAIVDTLWLGRAKVASSPIPSSVWAHRHGDGPWPHDPEVARRLLAEAGWQLGMEGILERDGEPFRIELLSNADNQVRANAMVMIQRDLEQVGVDARLRQLDHNTVVARALAGDFDAVLMGFNIDTSLDLHYAFHSSQIDGGLNLAGYQNPEVDRLIERQRSAAEPAEVGELLEEIQAILHLEQPFTMLWEPQRLYGTHRRLQGMQINPLSSLFAIEEWWLAPVAGEPAGSPGE